LDVSVNETEEGAVAVEEEPDEMEDEDEKELTDEELDEETNAPDKDEEATERETVRVVMPQFGERGAGELWETHEDKIVHIVIGDIAINPLQPRRSFDPQDMEELKESIENHGILQPLVVRRLEDGDTYELIAGERRLRAAKSLAWDKVPCVVRRDVASDQSRLVFALIENIQRENLNPVEEAMAYQQLNTEYGLTHEEIGERVGKSRVGITNIMRLLQLPAEIQRGLIENKITIGHAKAILMIPDEEKQIRFYQHLLDEGLTVRKAEIRARRIQRSMKLNDPMRRKAHRGEHPVAAKYAPLLEERYGYDSYVKYNLNKNRYEILFRAYSDAEIEELISRLLGTSPLPLNQDKDVMEDDVDLDEEE
ncbi:MAG: ParB/RepB/Spo0J family partition protein, partial [Acidobacteriota bacterium]